jgi:membrane protease YdiL (CAAX protease family)
MIKYKRFQFGWIITVIFLIVIIWMSFAYLYQWGDNPVDLKGYIIFMILFCGVLLTFYGMTVIVTEKYIKIKFGIGLIVKKIDLSTIKSAAAQTYPIYYGYGIRFIPNGVLYNVSGSQAVELKFKNKTRVIQIGTNDWEKLKNVINSSIS